MKYLYLLTLLLTGFSQSATAHDPETGWWWNADQPGRGYSIEQQGSTIFFAAYLYSESGFPTWFIAALSKEGEHGFKGKLETFANGQTLLGEYQAPDKVDDNAGEITLEFTDDDKGILTWPGGTVPITRFRFASAETGDQSANTAAIAKGSTLFATNCSNSTCHGTNPSLNQNNILSGKNPGTIRSAFKNVQRMIDAGVPSRVSDEQILDIATYLDSLQ